MTQATQHIHVHMDTLSYLGVPVDVISIAVTGLIGIAQLIAIFRGLGQMKRISQEGNEQLAQQSKQLIQQAIDSERRHEQAMGALRALIERTSPPSPEPAGG